MLSEHGVSIAPSTYCERHRRPVTAAELEEAYLVNALVTLHAENWGVYGARRLHKAARRAGIDVGRDQVARLMRIAGIAGAVRGRHRTTTTRRDTTALRHPDLVQRGWDVPAGTDQLWVADLKCRRRHWMSASHRVFGASAVKSRITRSSWTGGPGFLPLRPRFFPNADHQPSSEQIFHTVRSAIGSPASRASSTRNR
ncbi:IS3 family transposase [Nocardioides sp. JS614]|uniref:IS3 family transposase n=1 Tax=Nocardioides sp. (strain ATCC BAA-499 / JS614) TaxID=196162 RepID=UPI003FD26C64